MKKIFKKVLYAAISFGVVIVFSGLILAFLPTKSKTHHVGISPEEAADLRQNFKGAHNQFVTTDGQTLFLRRWHDWFGRSLVQLQIYTSFSDNAGCETAKTSGKYEYSCFGGCW
jgi:hypothetical protein